MSNSPKAILIVDDNENILTVIGQMLELEGYHVITATDGKEALKIIQNNDLSLVLLDLILPDMDGIIVCQNIRRFSQIPIIMLTGRSEKDEIAASLYAGADDYITKPFSHSELIARVAAIIRRTSNVGIRSDQSTFQYQDLRINYSWQVVILEDKKIDLTDTEYKILVCLARHVDEIVAPNVLIKEIWGEYNSQSLDALRVNIFRLRGKLNNRDGQTKYIETVPGQGYSFK
jgi:DNA-binding response OmpR family regulator